MLVKIRQHFVDFLKTYSLNSLNTTSYVSIDVNAWQIIVIDKSCVMSAVSAVVN